MSPLRLIVACDRCARQLDATGLAAGSRFRCACGELLTVPAATSHQAAVVRCSSCGAPRQGQALSCGFCGADFTLREQDLDTICPKCLARISGKGRFCHHCATPLLVEERAGEPSEHTCPACGAQGRTFGGRTSGGRTSGRRLSSRRLGSPKPGEAAFSALECGVCGGLWIGAEAFQRLAERARAGEVEALSPGGPQTVVPAVSEPKGKRKKAPLYRGCPICSGLMNRQNYGRSSGIILDVCARHGVWFDADELERLLAWIKRGGIAFEEKRRLEEESERQRAERLKRLEERGEVPPVSRSDSRQGHADLLTAVVELAGRALGWLGRDAR